MKTIVTMGRGGTGKTSFVALMTKYLIETGRTPILLLDIDPDQNLDEMVGVDLVNNGKKTISELLIDTFLHEGGTTFGVPPSERIEGKIWENGLYEGKHFDLIAVGTKWIEGCYCLPDAAIKRALGRLVKTYSYILIDSPAGLEHLNRKIASKIDDIFDVMDSSKKAFEHVKRTKRIVREVNIEFTNFYVVGGYRFPKFLEEKVEKRTGFKYLGKITHDKKVEEYVSNGRSLLELPSSSPAYVSTKEILNKAW